MDRRRYGQGHRTDGDRPGDVAEFARAFLQISAITLVYLLVCFAAIQ